MNDLIHKPWFFTTSVVIVLLLSLGTWSMLHQWKPFVGGSAMGPGGHMRGNKNFGSGMQRNMSGDNHIWSGGIEGHMRPDMDNITDKQIPSPNIN